MSGEDLYAFATASCTSCSTEVTSPLSPSPSTATKCPACGKVLVRVSRFAGVVYILQNPSFGDLLKIGFTTKRLEERIAGLNGTNVPEPFECIAAFHSFSPREDEKKIHDRLREYRGNKNREFFSIAPDRAVSICEKIIGRPPFRSTIRPKRIVEDRVTDQSTGPQHTKLPVDSTKLLQQRREHLALAAVVVVLAILIKCC